MRRALVTFALLPYFIVSSVADGGVVMGGHVGVRPHSLVVMGGHVGVSSIKPGANRGIKLVTKVRFVKWIDQTGRSVVRAVSGQLPANLTLSPPPGLWTDIELVFEGPVSVQGEDGQTVALQLDALLFALEEPVVGGRAISLELDLLAPDGIWDAGPRLGADDVLILAIRDAALARVR